MLLFLGAPTCIAIGVMDILGKTKLWIEACYMYALAVFSLWLGMFIAFHI